MANQVFIVGHKNPDNDSIAAAVSYAYLKNALEAKKAEPEAEYVACCLGPLPQESATILEQVGLPAPKLIEKLSWLTITSPPRWLTALPMLKSLRL